MIRIEPHKPRQKIAHPNRAIKLSKKAIAIKLLVDGTAVKIKARPLLKLQPYPRLSFKFKAPYINSLNQGDIVPIEILPYGSKPKVRFTSISNCWFTKNIRGSFRLAPPSYICDLFEKRHQQIHVVKFDILNFPEFPTDIKLRVDHWKIEIIAVRNIDNVKNSLENEGGYSLTHSGTIYHSDGKAFSVDDAICLLDALRFCLSFAKGAFCSTIMEVGIDNHGKPLWRRFSNQHVKPWDGGTHSCFYGMDSKVLADFFSVIWNRFRDFKPEEPILHATNLYLTSNVYGPVHGGPILMQAALECLSHIFGYNKGKPVSKRIRKTIIAAGIDPLIPNNCESLILENKNHSGKEKWDDGPHVITMLRNNIVHPRVGKSSYKNIMPKSENAIYESWNLGQMYIELLILNIFGYNGIYRNRTTKNWQWEYVPWAK